MLKSGKCFPQWVFLALVAVIAQSSRAQAEDWPGWRGPRGDGSSVEIWFAHRFRAEQYLICIEQGN